MSYKRQCQTVWLLAATPAIAFLLLQLWPLGVAARSALTDEAGQWTWTHVHQVFADRLFRRSIAYSLLVPVVSVSLEALAGLGLALWFYRLRRGKALWRTVAILPFAMPEIVYLLTMKLVFRQHGYLNSLLFCVGRDKAMIGWLEPGMLMVAVIILVDAWRVTPVVFLIVLAALEQIPPSFLEAAQIDGANRWQIQKFVQIPLVIPALLVALALRAVDAFRIFATPLVLVGVEPLPVLTSVAYYYQADAHNAAAANVAALTLSLALFAMTAAAFFLIGRGRQRA